ncbi:MULTISPECIES: S-ribosylhomocysteine lyase [unclassified Candidatus Frackibacter]|uniref:S-ribosylhomocysteine lyase n=1 Tax=unclassified Candidatus Frackibacter TaxID=2648818 RepID=UPI0008BAB865|nr:MULTISPECIES: S-ribosylhomocysteine lyase [unclassified Candidatus Frackibacter]SEM71987.1 S-ribosylhomocysteine lyase /quorum-sensing autoinducer 2 (AI-2) synthesis protein LuxS [Candidatus Frackibacter sp. WG12]SFL82340.1 S-ribosylhomocysteine lyase /quorum-sensing autoinducer 2 (AI-2) synthesis protein LuxS [Candidatus Frackibacter sp. WG13]
MDIKVESFQLDHTKVNAPYVRKAGKIETPKGDIIQKYDLRLLQPNEGAVSTAALHSLEHLLAGYMRERIENIVDISPMGCRTGFYLIVVGEPAVDEVKAALIDSLKVILETDEVEATTAKECGNYRDHSLFGAKEYSKEVLANFKNK